MPFEIYLKNLGDVYYGEAETQDCPQKFDRFSFGRGSDFPVGP